MKPQTEVIAFLLSSSAWPVEGPAEHIETHGAHVFLCGETALKIKRAVHYDYMDLSTTARRKTMLRRELDLNKPSAPMIYRDLIAITREADGRLALDGQGKAVEWVLRMHRFPASAELTAIVAQGALTLALAEDLGRAIARYHAAAPRRRPAGDALIHEIIDELDRVFATLAPEPASTEWLGLARAALNDCAGLLRQRARTGHVRRVHGDLHLRNIVIIDRQPVLFDALEFDERLGTCDVLYDLGFLVMDLCHNGLGFQANAVLNAYLLAAGGSADSGLVALPLFLSVRAAIRAMVALQTAKADPSATGLIAEAGTYLDEALAHLRPKPVSLLVIGGDSGTGKTVLARALAPLMGACPGAVHLRTDTERKAAAAPVAYDLAARDAVYQRMFARAARILAAGHSILLDATFTKPEHRAQAEVLARTLAVPLQALWLTAPEPELVARVTARKGDASDAGRSVVHAQVATAQPGPPWITLDALGSIEATRAAAFTKIGLHPTAA